MNREMLLEELKREVRLFERIAEALDELYDTSKKMSDEDIENALNQIITDNGVLIRKRDTL